STAEKSDGVIIVTNNLRKNRSEMGLDLRPVVITGFDMPGETCVLNDDYGCMKGAIQYLYENGHKKVGFISQPISHQTVGERYRGFLDGIREYNLTPVDELVYVNEMTDGEINNLIKGMMSKGMDSLILSNLFVPAISNELKKLNVSIPNDISILVFNDFEDKPMIDAGYSVIQSRRFEMGRAAVRTLIQLINGEIESGTKQIIPTRLIEGRTVRKNREGYC
ncbi:MAG: substrate-binding domain-containing protein, partial [Firmicutes bacterium]|nr:substrate-binding domain-containing protein [Bacillota bacterium]